MAALALIALIWSLRVPTTPAGTGTADVWTALAASHYQARAATATTVDGVPVETTDVFLVGYSRMRAAPQAVQERRWFVRRPGGKYPLVRIHEEVDPHSGRVLVRNECVGDHLLVQLQAGVDADALTARLAPQRNWRVRRCWPRQG
ncbi:MAG: hypothetical protein ACOCXJ_09045, partial [Planctomycetota bacterium]